MRPRSLAPPQSRQEPAAPHLKPPLDTPPTHRAGFLCVVVERAKKCLDFTATLYFLHFLFCLAFRGFPSSLEWWVLNFMGLVLMAVLGEWLCLRRELREIPLVSGLGVGRDKARRAAAAEAGCLVSSRRGGGNEQVRRNEGGPARGGALWPPGSDAYPVLSPALPAPAGDHDGVAGWERAGDWRGEGVVVQQLARRAHVLAAALAFAL